MKFFCPHCEAPCINEKRVCPKCGKSYGGNLGTLLFVPLLFGVFAAMAASDETFSVSQLFNFWVFWFVVSVMLGYGVINDPSPRRKSLWLYLGLTLLGLSLFVYVLR